MKTIRKIFIILLSGIVLLLLLAAATYFWLRYEVERAEVSPAAIDAFFQQPAQRSPFASAVPEPCKNNNSLNNAYFGALHIHTAASFDATAFGVTNSADDAYAFATGQPLELRLLEDDPEQPVPVITISQPLDFAAVTDHAEQLGERSLCYDPREGAHGTTLCKVYRGDIRLPMDDLMQPLIRLASQAIFGISRSARVCGPDGSDCRERAADIWRDNQRAAEEWQDHSGDCSFTTFHAYEYTLAEQSSNLHRNVIFKSEVIPQRVASAKDKNTPEELWQWLQDKCRSAQDECDVMTIPHNSNWSSGRMWFPYSASELPIEEQRAYAALRAEMEPLVEIMQVKGDSECRNGLTTVFGGADELCDFEKLREPAKPFEDCGEEFGAGGMTLSGCLSRFSYVRYALSEGLEEQRKLGSNPFKLGIIAATDNHNATAAAGLERGHLGANGVDREARRRLNGAIEVPGGIAKASPVRFGPGGIAGVWAPENSRSALFEAMKRRETFGTSGPRIIPRLFAGWNLPTDLCQSGDFAQRGYALGVPMGGDFPPPPDIDAAPSIAVSVLKDSRQGGNLLQRIQIIKGWVDDRGQTHQAVYDIAGDAGNGASVDINNCEVTGSGFDSLCAVWRDPQFDPGQSAVYYARIVENPSCRWSTYDCNALPPADRPASCSDPAVPKTIQERAWTSPVWYNAPAR